MSINKDIDYYLASLKVINPVGLQTCYQQQKQIGAVILKSDYFPNMNFINY